MTKHIPLAMMSLLLLFGCDRKHGQSPTEDVREIKIIKDEDIFHEHGKSESVILNSGDLMYLRRLQEIESKKFNALPKTEQEKLYARWKTEEVKIGMSGERVMLSCWGKPDSVKVTQPGTRDEGSGEPGVPHQHWSYKRGSLFFVNDVLIGIQLPTEPIVSHK